MRFVPAIGFIMVSLLPCTALPADNLPWSYDGMENGQDSWGSLSPDYAKCEVGTSQSPVVISYTTHAELKPLAVQYKESKATVAFSNYTIDITPAEGNILVADGISYKLKHIVFHSPSEHTVLDKYYTLEIQLMHESSDGRTLALAIFADSGDELTGINPLIENLPSNDGTPKEFTFNPALLLPGSLGYYAYSGSMTIPPCTENVEWRVLKKPLGMSYKQMDAIISLTKRNARLEQAVYSRTIQETNF